MSIQRIHSWAILGLLLTVGGLDHVLAMLAVGLWGAQLGSSALWVLPVAFPMVMAVGGFLALIGIPLPGVELGIALSGVVLGGEEQDLGVRLLLKGPLQGALSVARRTHDTVVLATEGLDVGR